LPGLMIDQREGVMRIRLGHDPDLPQWLRSDEP
jgi:hypothetical protein